MHFCEFQTSGLYFKLDAYPFHVNAMSKTKIELKFRCYFCYFRPLVDRTTVMGYLVYSAIELVLAGIYYSAYCCIITLFISPCLYLEALCMDFEQMCHENDKFNIRKSVIVLEKRQRLIDAINFQSKIQKYRNAQMQFPSNFYQII